LKRQAQLFSESDLVRFFHSLAETETKLRTAAHPRYQLEIGLVKLMEMRRLEPLTQLVDRIGAIEESLRTGKPVNSTSTAPGGGGGSSPTSSRTTTASGSRSGFSASAAATAPAFAPDKSTDLPVQALNVEAPEMRTDKEGAIVSEIERIKSALEGRRKMFLVTSLENASMVSIDGDELYVEFTSSARHLRDTLAKSENVKILRATCHEVRGKETGVRIVVKDQAANQEIPLSKEDELRLEQQRLRKEAEKNPIVQQMVRTFRGEITDVQPYDGK
jgi:hypothetical protein